MEARYWALHASRTPLATASLRRQSRNGWSRPVHCKLDGDVGDIDLNNYVSRYASIIAEIRARQPQARILLFGVFPRYQTDAEPSMENAVLARLANNETVFFIDMTRRFFRADGAFDERMWATGLQEPAFKAWAEELQPWLDRFLR